MTKAATSSTKDIQAGIIRLHPGDNDSQEPHSVDELYFERRAGVGLFYRSV